MNIPRISGVFNLLPERQGGGERAALPAPGETVLLTLGEQRGDEMLAATPGGLILRLTGLGALNRDLQPGDTLSMRVTANGPLLELQFYDAQAAAGSGGETPAPFGDLPAMRLDLAGLRAIAWSAPNAAALAAAWQAQAGERTMFPVYVWSGAQRGGLQMVLTLADWQEASPRAAPHRRRPRAIQIELAHPLHGYITIEVKWRLGGIALTLAVEAAAAQAVRAMLPAVAAALSHAKLRLVRVRLTAGRAQAVRRLAPPQSAAFPTAAFESTEPPDSRLFRAAAEVAVTLLNPLKLNPANPRS